MNGLLAAWLRSARLEQGEQRPRSAHFDELMRWPPTPGSEWRVVADTFHQALEALPGNGPVIPVVYVPLTFRDGSRYSDTPEWQPPTDFDGRLAQDEPPTLAVMPKSWWPAKFPITYYRMLLERPVSIGEVGSMWYRLCGKVEPNGQPEYVLDVVIEPSVEYWATLHAAGD